jgi:rubredoxin
MTEESIVRQNLMDNVNYRPYCGNTYKGCSQPRTEYRTYDSQFICPECKWISAFPEDFIKRYKEKHQK